MPSSIASSASDQSPFDADDLLFSTIPEDLEVSDELPGIDTIEDAAELPVYDENGVGCSFGSLFSGDRVVNQRQLFVFVRFFYCGVSGERLQKATYEYDRL